MHNAITSLPSGMKTSSRLSSCSFSSLSLPYAFVSVPPPVIRCRRVTKKDRTVLLLRAFLISRYTIFGQWNDKIFEQKELLGGIPGQDRRYRNVKEMQEPGTSSVTKREGKSEGSTDSVLDELFN